MLEIIYVSITGDFLSASQNHNTYICEKLNKPGLIAIHSSGVSASSQFLNP